MKNIYKWNNQRLDVINKMALLRKGNVPVSVVVLQGHKQNVEFVAKKEAEILGSYFSVMKKMDDMKSGVINFVPCDVENGNLDWLTAVHELIDVDAISIFDWAAFFEKLGLDGAKEEMFADFDNNHKEALSVIENQVITTVLYAHYEHCDDNTITDMDVRQIKGMVLDRMSVVAGEKSKQELRAAKAKSTERQIKGMELEHMAAVAGEKSKQELKAAKQNRLDQMMGDVTPLKESVKKGRGEVQNDKEAMSNEALVGAGDKVPVVSEAGPKKESVEAPTQDPSSKPVVEPAAEPKIEEPETVLESDDETVIPKPKENAPKKPAVLAKETLTEEEEKENAALLEDLRTMYKDTIRFMNDTCNAQYRIIVNSMQDAVDKNVYKQQFTKMYLNVSDDTGSELYRKLYDIDVATQKFHKTVVHQVKHMGCFNCGTNWDEDITFLPHGPHTVRCPHCFADIPFEK